MPAPLPIRTDRDATELRHLARGERAGRLRVRLLALANALDGLPREETARLAGMTGQTLGDWVHRYTEAGVEGLRDRRHPGSSCALDEGQQAALKALVLRSPRAWSAGGCVAWRARDLCALVEARFGCATARAGYSSSSKASTCRGRRPGRSSPRPTRRRRSGEKNLPDLLRRVAGRHPEAASVELWLMDEARIGQKGRTTHVW